MDYANKTILITGASSGIGRATALALAPFNNRLVITARRQELLEETADQIREMGSLCMALAGDALDGEFAREVVDQIVAAHGGVDIALLNIGVGPPSNCLTASGETILDCMRANYDTMVHFFVPLMAQMKEQKSPCLIAHMNSQASYFGIPMQGDYTAAKGAARLFFDTARMELKHFGISHIRLQTIHPGFVDTLAVRGDGIPAPNEISEEDAALYVLKGFKREMRENLFPPATAWATRLGRFLPRALLTRVLLAATPKTY